MTVRVLTGDCRDVLPKLDAGSAHCVVTSPPYFGLRNYGHAGQIGLEATPAEFIAALVEVMRHVRRVLRDDGVAWMVLGDSYAATGGHTGQGESSQRKGRSNVDQQNRGTTRAPEGVAPGNLLMIPARVALALQADGWTLRQVVTWAKVAPMPESVSGTRWERCKARVGVDPKRVRKSATNAGSFNEIGGNVPERDAPQPIYAPCPGCPRCAATDGYVLRRGSWRHTSATEQALMLTKGMGYWADQEAVREANSSPEQAVHNQRYAKPYAAYDDRTGPNGTGQPGNTNNTGIHSRPGPGGRNPRNWVTPSPSPFPGSHFATFPPALIEPFIRATCPAKCCPTCGAGWAAVVERPTQAASVAGKKTQAKRDAGLVTQFSGYADGSTGPNIVTVGYRPTCACPPADPVPGVVLDPFLGAGTTGLVADRLGRDCVGIELNPDYARMAAERIRAEAPLLANVEVTG